MTPLLSPQKTIPYTYVIECFVTNKRYYGVRFAPGCLPEELWVTYFTSSKTIQKEILHFGKEAFGVGIRKIFEDATSARKWEEKVLTRLGVPGNPNWYNRTNNISIESQKGIRRSAATRKKMSLAKLQHNPQKGAPGPWRGKARPADTRKKISQTLSGRKGRPHTLLAKQKQSQAMKGRKRPPFSQEWCKNISLGQTGVLHWNYGKVQSESTKKKIGVANSIRGICPNCGKEGGLRSLRRHHFDNCPASRLAPKKEMANAQKN